MFVRLRQTLLIEADQRVENLAVALELMPVENVLQQLEVYYTRLHD
jgi:hypothetical protein